MTEDELFRVAPSELLDQAARQSISYGGSRRQGQTLAVTIIDEIATFTPHQIEAARRPPPAFDEAEFAALLDHVFYSMAGDIRQRYRPGLAPPCLRVRMLQELYRPRVDLDVHIYDGSRHQVRCELRHASTTRLLEYVGFTRICELYWDAEAAAFNDSCFHFDWRNDVELRNRIEDARRGLAPRPTTSEGFSILDIVRRGPRYAVTATEEAREVRAEHYRRMADGLGRRMDREFMQMADFGRGPDVMAYTVHADDLQLTMNRAGLHDPQAVRRGEQLLREWLSPEQRAQYEQAGHFDVVGCHTGNRYRIVKAASYNVQELDRDGRARAKLCFLPEGQLVPGDQMLAQKLALETDERGALAVANRDAIGPGRPFAELRWGFAGRQQFVDFST